MIKWGLKIHDVKNSGVKLLDESEEFLERLKQHFCKASSLPVAEFFSPEQRLFMRWCSFSRGNITEINLCQIILAIELLPDLRWTNKTLPAALQGPSHQAGRWCHRWRRDHRLDEVEAPGIDDLRRKLFDLPDLPVWWRINPPGW